MMIGPRKVISHQQRGSSNIHDHCTLRNLNQNRGTTRQLHQTTSKKKQHTSSKNYLKIVLVIFFLFFLMVRMRKLEITVVVHYEDGNDEASKVDLLQKEVKLSPTLATSRNNNKIRVFYNLYIQNESDLKRVEEIVLEQLSMMLPELHHEEVFINLIGYNSGPTIANHTITKHYEKGGEDITLHSLWEYCKRIPSPHEAKVAYLHSKGSFHDHFGKNTLMRKFLTDGTLSEECANLPDQCNVCSSRMSPLPHPHTPGNMWVARCDYISKLADPRKKDIFKDIFEKNPPPKPLHLGPPHCTGRIDRFFFEHWVHSHPSVKPCDLYPGSEYSFAYKNLPLGSENSNGTISFEKQLEMAPRFDFQNYVIKGGCPYHQKKENGLNERLWEYGFMYNQTPDESWWGWELYNCTDRN